MSKRKQNLEIKMKVNKDSSDDELPNDDNPLISVDPDTEVEVKEEPNFNLYVGTDLGILKGISLGGELPISKSILRPETLKTKPPAITSLTWVDESEKELLVAFTNHVVKTYNTKLRCFTRQVELNLGSEDEQVIGLCCHDPGNYIVGLQSGTVAMWNCMDSSTTWSIKTCDPKADCNVDLRKIRQCPSDKNLYASGGQENDLRIWNLASENPMEPAFKAKNIPHDNLDLRVPVWIEDLTFLPRTSELVAVGTRYGQIRLYDVRAGQRPVSNVQFVDNAIMSIAPTINDRQVLVGTATGEAGLYDLRNPGQEKLVLKYFGPAGSIRSVVASTHLPYFATCGLDRHVYVYKLTERNPVKKLYVQQQLNCIAVSKSFTGETSSEAKSRKAKSKIEDDWANIPEDVLLANEPVSPVKKSRKSIKS